MISIFRRLAFSPDGSAVIVPSGQILNGENYENCAYIFSIESPSLPVIALPTKESAHIAHFCPMFFKKELNESSLWKTEFRFLFCLMSRSEFYIYSSVSKMPLYMISGMHCASMTDVSWLNFGRLIIISSLDGYLSFIEIEERLLEGIIDFESEVKIPSGKV